MGHFNVDVDDDDGFYIALFSAPETRLTAFLLNVILSKQTWCFRSAETIQLTRDGNMILSDSLFIACFESPPKWCAYGAVWLLHGWCHVKLMPSRCVLCTLYNNASYHVTSCKATYVGCMRVTCHLYFWQND